MRIILVGALLWSALSSVAAAQEMDDPMDMSRQEARVEQSGIPTVSEVADLKQRAKTTFESGDCGEALPIIREHAEKANQLANLMRAGLEPFYSASLEDRQSAISRDLAAMEKRVNERLRDRNEAWVMEAECLLSEGDEEGAVVRLVHALQYIDVRELGLWVQARTNLWKIIGAAE